MSARLAQKKGWASAWWPGLPGHRFQKSSLDFPDCFLPVFEVALKIMDHCAISRNHSLLIANHAVGKSQNSVNRLLALRPGCIAALTMSGDEVEHRGRKKKPRPDPIGASADELSLFQRDIARRLAEARIAKGWSPEDLARRSGLSAQSIRKIEECRSNVLAYTVHRLARALGLPAGWLAFGG